MYNGQQPQNSNLEFINFIPTPGEKHLGIAVIRLERRFIFRFKVAPSSNGQGLWVTKAAYKIGLKPDGKDNYDDSFEFDSTYEKKQIDSFVEQNVQAFLSRSNPNAAPSAFAQPSQNQFAQHQQGGYAAPQTNNYSQPAYQNNVPAYATTPMPEYPPENITEDPGLPF